jgi:hypothetical protein
MTTAGGRNRPSPGTRAGLTPIQKAAAAVGIVFVLVGILGFVPGITTHYKDMKFAGHQSEAMLLGTFCVSILHNIVHLLFGLVGLAMSRTVNGARTFLIGGGVIYLVLFVYGILIDKNSKANFIPINNADNILHLILGIAMIGVGVALGRRAVDARQ